MAKFQMIKKIFAIITGVLFMAHPAAFSQEVSGYPIGFCNGEMNTRSNLKFSGKGSTVSTAIHIPSNYAATVSSNRLEYINVALASKLNLKTLKVWVRTQLDGPDIVSKTLEKGEFAQGWNNVKLDSPYEIPAEAGDGFYIGYTYEQTNKAGAISSLTTPHAGALWTKHDDGEWTDMSADGTLCIEGMVYGDNLPKYNLSILSATTDPYFIISEGTLNCYAKIRNLATVNATSFEIETTMEGASAPCKSTVECNLALGESGTYKFTISPEFSSDYNEVTTAYFKITAVNGVEDEDIDDNTAETTFNIIARAFKKIVLAEEFTTENCPNCPAVGKYFHNILEDPEFSSNLEVICHHEGYYSDWLTTDFDAAYTWFYNAGGSMYAPAAMLDRTRYQDTDSPVFFPQTQELLADAINTQMLIPAMVSVNPTASLTNDNSQISVTVEGERVSSNIFEDDRITVFVIEDNIKAKNQAGAGGVYIHDHVNRAVNDTWGAPLEWNGNTYTYTCTFDINPEWNMDNVKIVAFISHYDSEDANNCGIANTGVCTSFTSGVDSLMNKSERIIRRIYTIDGKKTNELTPGFNIVVYDDNSVEKRYL